MDRRPLYSCDDHLDLSRGAARRVGVAAAARRWPSAARASSTRDGHAGVGVRRPRDRPQRHRGEEQGAAKKLERDRPRRHRRRRLPRRHARAAAPGHGPRRLAGVGDLRAALARLPDQRPGAAERVLRGVERLGRRGVQRGRARPAVRARVPARPLRPTRPPRSSNAARRSATAARSSSVFDIDLGDPAWDRLWAAAAADRPADQLPHQGRHLVELSYQMGKWQSAAFASLLPLQLDEPLATMVFSGALERHPG